MLFPPMSLHLKITTSIYFLIGCFAKYQSPILKLCTFFYLQTKRLYLEFSDLIFFLGLFFPFVPESISAFVWLFFPAQDINPFSTPIFFTDDHRLSPMISQI
jgi:hypothetical protein